MEQRVNLQHALLGLTHVKECGMTLIDNSTNDKWIPYSEILEKAKKTLAYLQQKGLKRGSKLIFQVEDAEIFVSLFWGCVLGGIIPVPLAVGTKEEQKDRLSKVWNQMPQAYIVSERALQDSFGEQVIYTSEITEQETDGTCEIPEVCLEDIVLIQFSSGSTGMPKGVVISHKNVVTNLLDIREKNDITEKDSILSWSSLSHNLGLILSHIFSLYFHLNQYIIPTKIFIQQPGVWLEKVTQYKATITICPNFGYRHFLEMTSSDSYQSYQLSSIRVIYNGGEPVSVANYSEFIETLAPYGMKEDVVCPSYGLSEACAGVSVHKAGHLPHYVNVSRDSLGIGETIRVTDSTEDSVQISTVGTLLSHVAIRIAAPGKKDCGEQVVGSIQLKGDSISLGYYENKIATKEIFTEDGWLITGDLGFLYKGELYITGREKDIIIVKGQNHYVQDLERVIEELEEIFNGSCIVTGVQNKQQRKEEILVFLDNNTGKYNGKEVPDQKIKEQVLQKTGLIVERVIPISEIPRTRSNKIQRFELVKRYQNGEYGQAGKNQMEEMKDRKHKAGEHHENVVYYESEDIQEAIKDELKNLLGFYLEDVNQSIINAGVDSVTIARLTVFLKKKYNRSLPIDFCFQHCTIADMAEYLKKSQPEMIESKKKKESGSSEKETKKVAVIGIGCRFPAGSHPEEYWQALKEGKDCITGFPKDRWQEEDGEEAEAPYAKEGGFFKDYDYREMDADFFQMSEEEAVRLDPQQRVVLEVIWETFYDAGLREADLEGSNTGVFIGAGKNEYETYISDIEMKENASYLLIGNTDSAVSGRVSYLLGLEGPSMTVDTACSSSLAAVHLACKSILNKECDMAFAGGVNVLVNPSSFDKLAYAGMLSKTGKCHTFDASADGYVRAEGCGILLLKELSKAMEDGDSVYAVISGTSMKHVGRSGGLTIPKVSAEEEVIRNALDDAGVLPEEVSYIEAHGTGTSFGDAMEMEAIENIFARQYAKEAPLYVGSVKTNIGHMEAASGIAGLIKVILSLKNRGIPAHIGLHQVNPYIDLSKTNIEIPKNFMPWDIKKGKRIAGVSAFGFTGTNVHVVVEEAPNIDNQSWEKEKAICVFHRKRYWMEKVKEETQKEEMPKAIREHIPFSSLFYQLDWKEVESGNFSESELGDSYEQYIIFTDKAQLCDQMKTYLQKKQKICIKVDCAEEFMEFDACHYSIDVRIGLHFHKLFQLLKDKIEEQPTCIIYGLPLDAKDMEALDGQKLYEEENFLLGGFLHLTHGVCEIAWRQKPKVWILTKGCQISQTEQLSKTEVFPSLAALWGVGRTFSVEQKEYWGGIADLDGKDTESCIGKLLWAISQRGMEDQLRVKRGKLLAARMVRQEDTADWKDKIVFEEKAMYLITGGLGGIGLELAKWMAANGARHIVLLNSSGFPERQRWEQMKADGEYARKITVIEGLEKNGVEVMVLKADVNRVDSMRAGFQRIRERGLPLKGVIHAASRFSTQPMQEMDEKTLLYYQKAKLVGTMHLHELTKNDKLDFFVLFSSLSGIWGTRDLAHYAAGNCFLDAFAQYRKILGLPATSVSWGAWGKVGVMTRNGYVRQFIKIGHYSLEPSVGVKALGACIASGKTHSIVVDADWNRVKKVFRSLGSRLCEVLENKIQEESMPRDTADTPSRVDEGKLKRLAKDIKESAGEAKTDCAKKFLKELTTELLGGELAQYQWERSFMALGVTSKMVLEMNQLMNSIVDPSEKITITDFFNYTTIESLANHLIKCIGEEKNEGEEQKEEETEDMDLLSDLLDEIEGYSDEYIDEKWNK